MNEENLNTPSNSGDTEVVDLEQSEAKSSPVPTNAEHPHPDWEIDQRTTSRKSSSSYRSLSLGSLQDAVHSSQNELNDSGIGKGNFLDDKLELSPIRPRPSELGVCNEDEDTERVEILEKAIKRFSETISESTDTNDCRHDENSTAQDNELGVMQESIREEVIEKAQKEAGASSHAFFESLRSAADQRKKQFTRSRDSLVAKEQRRREESERIAASEKQYEQETISQEIHQPAPSHYQFHARPLPKSIHMGGVSGLPKVDKRPVTAPFSPMLGFRRGSMHSAVSYKPKLKPVEENGKKQSFRARPLPTAFINNVGSQSGVPKVEKRPTTTPFSPLLGARRPNGSQLRRSIPANTRGTSSSISTNSSSDSTPLGLEFLPDSENRENRPEPTGRKDRKMPEFNEFKLESTGRAQKRAAFEEAQKQRMEMKKKQERRKTKARIGELEQELEQLRWEL